MRRHPSPSPCAFGLPIVSAILGARTLGSQVTPSTAIRQPVVLVGRQVTAVVSAPLSLVSVSDSASVARALTACPQALLDRANAAFSSLPWSATSLAKDDRVLVVLIPAPAGGATCDVGATSNPALLARGIQVVARPANTAWPGIGAVEISVSGRILVPDSMERRKAVLVSDVGEDVPGGPVTQLVAWITADRLAPNPSGKFPDIELHVST